VSRVKWYTTSLVKFGLVLIKEEMSKVDTKCISIISNGGHI